MDTENKRSILVVDDEEIIRDFLSEVLEDYSLTLASDGDEAIDKIKEQQFDLIITDLRMPRVSGEEVVKTARETCPDTKVIVISGYSSLYTISQSASSGAFAFLSKPFSIKELMQTVATALGEG
ncbi:MAG: response regulator [Planctomycetota bacterium]